MNITIAVYLRNMTKTISCLLQMGYQFFSAIGNNELKLRFTTFNWLVHDGPAWFESKYLRLSEFQKEQSWMSVFPAIF